MSRPDTGDLITGDSGFVFPVGDLMSSIEGGGEEFWPFAESQQGSATTERPPRSFTPKSSTTGLSPRELGKASVLAYSPANTPRTRTPGSSVATPASRESSRQDSTRPPSVVQPSAKLTRGQGIVYLDMLLALMDPKLAIAKETGKLVQFIFESWIWMDALWHYLVRDIRRGSCSTIVPRSVLQEDAWERLASDMKPDPDTADTLEAALRTMCFHQRAGKLQQTLEKLGVAKASTELRNGNHFAAHQKRFKEERLQSLHGKTRRRHGALVLSWEAEAADAHKVPNDIPRTFQPYVPVSAREQ